VIAGREAEAAIQQALAEELALKAAMEAAAASRFEAKNAQIRANDAEVRSSVLSTSFAFG
jgi:hypothetical protein